ncbi:MAG: hypothetical protein [Caudoviricetes sp.]|nr:MAG: hypothetical protein [Caudoviricetes sp.]
MLMTAIDLSGPPDSLYMTVATRFYKVRVFCHLTTPFYSGIFVHPQYFNSASRLAFAASDIVPNVPRWILLPCALICAAYFPPLRYTPATPVLFDGNNRLFWACISNVVQRQFSGQ